MDDEDRLSVEDRLNDLLREKEHEIRELHEEIEELETTIRGIKNGWAAHRKAEDADESLPVPRLEFAWEQEYDSWASYHVEYRLVMKHLLDHLVIVPLGNTRVSGGDWDGPAPYKKAYFNEEEGRHRGVGFDRSCLPFRDGAHASHDSAHLNLPCYAITDEGAVLIEFGHGAHQQNKGHEHRRGHDAT